VPPKIRDLIKQLTENGFENRGGKGSHRNYKHPKGPKITISGKTSYDAKPYQIKDVKKVIQKAIK